MSDTKIDIIEIHRKCLDFLLEYQLKNPNFFFVPRKINNKNRLADGMYFRGNNNYLALSFWNSSDSKEQIYNISFSIDSNGKPYLDLTCRDDDAKISHIIEIKELIEKRNSPFHEKKVNRWRYFYPDGMDYLDALKDFILNEKPKIDEYVTSHPECNIPMADVELHNKYVKTLPIYKVYKDAIDNKKTGSTVVKASEYYMRFRHNELSNELVNYLNTNNYNSVVTDENCVDIKAIDSDGNQLLFELKTASSVKYAIRYALGQLLEYNHYPDCTNADKLIIVTSSELELTAEDIQYLKNLRNLYKLPIYYQQFDITNKLLSEEY